MLIILKWSNDLFFISKVQTSDVVFKDLFWWLPQHTDPVTSFLLTPRHILRSYCPNNPHIWGGDWENLPIPLCNQSS